MIIDRAKIVAALPHYELGDEIGQGGFGLVFSARHRRLGQLRAVKAIVIAPSDEARASSRFLTEAQVMTELDHPHIVRVHEYAEHDNVRLLVMEYLAGGTLTSRLTGPVEPAVACAWALAVADALQAAHERGVLHRDIKPDNLLFTANGFLKVTDFGIAKLFASGSDISASVNVLGSPLYISPEQITGGRLGPGTDLYALGVTLYRMLVGHTPFPTGLPLTGLLLQHINETPSPLVGVPPQIAAVVLRALSKEPADRQASAREFAVDLARAATAELGPGWIGRSGVPLRLDPAVLDAAATPAPVSAPPSARASVPLPVSGSGYAPGRASGSASVPVSGPGYAPASGPPPAPGGPGGTSPGGAGRTSPGGPGKPPSGTGAPIVLHQPARISSGQSRPSRRRGAVIVGLVAVVLVVAGCLTFALTRNSGPGTPAANGSPTASPSAPTPSITHATVARPLEADSTVRSVAFSPDGQTVAGGSEDGKVRLWNTSTGALLHTLKGHTNWVFSVAFSPNGQTVASASGDKTVRLWNASTGELLHTLKGHTDWVYSVTFSPDGKTLASASQDGTVRLWNAVTGAPLRVLTRLNSHIWAVAFSPDGKTVACASEDGTIRLWTPGASTSLRTLTGHTKRVWAVAFSPDGRTLASASDDHTVRVWSVTTGKLVRTLNGHTSNVYSVAFSPDGLTLASASDDHTVRLWNESTGAPLQTLTNHTDRVWSVAFSRDGKTLATGSTDKTILLWTLS